jgi:hypothetical protein
MLMEARGLDPLEMARLFVSKEQSKPAQYKEASESLKTKKLDHLIGVERAPHHSVEVRRGAKAALIADWQKTYHEGPHKSLLMMAYSNRDVRDLNDQARTYLRLQVSLIRRMLPTPLPERLKMILDEEPNSRKSGFFKGTIELSLPVRRLI